MINNNYLMFVLNKVLPLFIDSMPRNVFAGLSAFVVAAALIARVVVQKDFQE